MKIHEVRPGALKRVHEIGDEVVMVFEDVTVIVRRAAAIAIAYIFAE